MNERLNDLDFVSSTIVHMWLKIIESLNERIIRKKDKYLFLIFFFVIYTFNAPYVIYKQYIKNVVVFIYQDIS